MSPDAAASWIPTPTVVSYDALLDPPFRDRNLKPDAQAVSAFANVQGWEYSTLR